MNNLSGNIDRTTSVNTTCLDPRSGPYSNVMCQATMPFNKMS